MSDDEDDEDAPPLPRANPPPVPGQAIKPPQIPSPSPKPRGLFDRLMVVGFVT